MCGVAGIIRFDKQKVTQNCLKKMTDSILHRGPDGEGFWINEGENIGLGHRRLAIIDLSDSAAQPMVCKKTGNVIVFNGEIYNYIELKNELKLKGYSFYTNSDTEVLLALYDYKKEDCLADLNGMFAFAIWNKSEQKLFCARDRFGEKPFYYYFDNNVFVFGSEMKALWSYGIKKEINQDVLINFVKNGVIKYTNGVGLYKYIKSLPPSSYLTIDFNQRKILIKNYYSVNDKNINNKINFDEACSIFLNYLTNSVKIRLRSDVQVGSSLSGGLDSSSIVAIIQLLKSNDKSHSFSARFKNFVKDEGPYIERVTRQYPSLVAHYVWPDENMMLDEMKKLVYHQEEPFASSSIYAQWCVMKLAKEHGVTVLLDGQGADEILGGYLSCIKIYLYELIFKNYFMYKKELKLYNSNQPPYAQIPSYEDSESLRMKLGRWKIMLTQDRKKVPYSFNGYLKQITTSEEDLQTLLRYADRNSMAFSREIRLPFLDHKLVDFTFTLPTNFKFKIGFSKYILRKVISSYLPPEVVWRPEKVGYEPPQEHWLNKTEINNIINKQAKYFGIEEIKDYTYSNSTSWRLFLSHYYM
ncbi:MAG: asparagine synthase (glutamine-hydrolyzing) [Thermoplasmata archaeon]